MGARITRMTLRGKPIDAAKRYKVAGWAPVSEEAKAAGGEAIWDVVARHLRARKSVPAPTLDTPDVAGARGDPGWNPSGR
jgi:sulfur-oxidizing protein SoxB